MSRMLAQEVYDFASLKFKEHQLSAGHSCKSVWCHECNWLGSIVTQASSFANNNPDHPEAM
jgi:hypothetical protein